METKEMLALFIVLLAVKEALCMSWFLLKLALKSLFFVEIVLRIAIFAMRLGILN